MPEDVETALYRIVQEALTNVVKHAGATRVSVLLTQRGERAAVVVEDNGEGFDADHQEHDGFGLVGMRERVELVGGRLRVESSEGSGTSIVAEAPLR